MTSEFYLPEGCDLAQIERHCTGGVLPAMLERKLTSRDKTIRLLEACRLAVLREIDDDHIRQDLAFKFDEMIADVRASIQDVAGEMHD